MRHKKFISLAIISAIFSIAFLLGANLVFADFTAGNKSSEISSYYGPGQIISGWINISLSNQSTKSKLECFNNQTNLLDFLNNNSAKFNCTPWDCKDYYTGFGGVNSKSFQINAWENKIFGLVLRGNLADNPVSQLSFNVESNAASSCYQQLLIDIGDDNDIDWIPSGGTGEHECSESQGYFDSSQVSFQPDISSTAEYCEKISINPAPGIAAGVDIIKGTSLQPKFTMSVYDSDLNKLKECVLPNIVSSGKYSCNLNISFVDKTDLFVCISADRESDYKISGENSGNNSGFYNIQNFNGFTADFSIFAKVEKFSPIGKFTFNKNSFRNYDLDFSENLEEYVNSYLSSTYNNDCSLGCVIPIKFMSGDNQNIILSNLTLKYATNNFGLKTENNFYDLNKTPAIINSDFLKLDLSKAGFIAPNNIGNSTLKIWLDERVVVNSDIQIKAISQIGNLSPMSAPALVPTDFFITMERSEANMTYKWNFGDESVEQTTTTKSARHTYPEIGSFELKVTAIGKNSQISKTFSINVVSPKDMINSTITKYKNDLANYQLQEKSLPEWIKNKIDEEIGASSSLEQINAIQKKYQEGTVDDAKALDYMRELIGLKIPYSLKTNSIISSSEFLMDMDSINPNTLSTLGAGSIDNEKEDLYRSVINWMRENADISLSYKVYSISFRNNNEMLFSHVNMLITPKKDIGEFYIIINGDPNEISFNSDIAPKNTREESVGIVYDDIKEAKKLEFYYPEAFDVLDSPIYVSPQFSQLSFSVDISECNLNGICEKENNETPENCSDCKKSVIGKIILWMAILFITAFIVYIILQEWYKNNYERHLFPDKNSLFNLINFMNNSESQGISKSDMNLKLRQMKWSGEQLTYAWNKLHGKRTGMWEIPIFKGIENVRVKKEIQKRQDR